MQRERRPLIADAKTTAASQQQIAEAAKLAASVAMEQANKDADAKLLQASAVEAARLKEEQAARERDAETARTQAEELAAKLAAEETERQKLSDELAKKEADQAAAALAARDELEKVGKEREQREAELRSEIDREKATSQLEKDRLLRDALDKEQAQQKAQDQAKAEQERVDKEAADKALEAEGDHAKALRDEIAQLEQQVADAKAVAATQLQKAEAGKKAASDATIVAVAPELQWPRLHLPTTTRQVTPRS